MPNATPVNTAGVGTYMWRNLQAPFRQRRWQSNLSGGGQATFSANGSTVSFTVTHSLAAAPRYVVVTPASADASGPHYVTNVTSTAFTVTYTIAPSTTPQMANVYVAPAGSSPATLAMDEVYAAYASP